MRTHAERVALKPARTSKWPRLRRRVLGPLAPLLQTLRGYERADLPKDALAGLTVAVVGLPQSVAFALIAGVPPIYGVYTAIVLGLLGALFSSSPFLAVGPNNTQSLLVAAIVGRMTHEPRLYLHWVFGLTLLKGLIQLAFAAARMGRLVRYVSRSVLVGFTAAAGLLVIVGQLPALLGLPAHLPSPDAGPGLLAMAGELLRGAPGVNPRALGIGALALGLSLGAERFGRGLPGPLLAVVGSAAAVWATGLGPADLPLIGALPRGLPGLELPRLGSAEVELLLSGALALALLGMLESVLIAKAVGPRSMPAIDPDQELFAQGFANLVGALFQCLPGSGSFSRSSLQYRAGAKTRVANLFCAGFNALIFLCLAPFAAYVPNAALAAILLIVGASLIDVRAIARVAAASRADAVVAFSTFASALVLPLSYAIYVGVFLSLALYLRHAGRLYLMELVPVEAGGFEERPLHAPGSARAEVIFIQLEGDLFFALADDVSEQLGRLVQSRVRVAILRLKRTRWIDASVLFALEQFVQAMHGRGAHVILCGVRPELQARLRSFGLEQVIDPSNVFATESGVFQSAKRAFARANVLLETAPEPREP